MLRIIVVVCVLALLLGSFSPGVVWAEDAPPEVVAARSSAKEHNRRVADARAELEQAVRHAHRKYLDQVIQAKQRLIQDLRRTLRDAAEGDRPENLLAISQQIEKLDKQIEALKLEGKRAADLAKGDTFDRYHGRWSITWPNGHNRRIEIDADGKVTVKANSSGNGPESGVGSTYQAKLINGYLAYHDENWAKPGKEAGRILFLKINKDDTVSVGYSYKDLQKADTLQTANEVWKLPLDKVFTPLAKKDAPGADSEDGPGNEAEDPVNPDPDPDPDPEPGDTDNEAFFGVPIE